MICTCKTDNFSQLPKFTNTASWSISTGIFFPKYKILGMSPISYPLTALIDFKLVSSINLTLIIDHYFLSFLDNLGPFMKIVHDSSPLHFQPEKGCGREHNCCNCWDDCESGCHVIVNLNVRADMGCGKMSLFDHIVTKGYRNLSISPPTSQKATISEQNNIYLSVCLFVCLSI